MHPVGLDELEAWATESALVLPRATWSIEVCCPRQWIMATSAGSWRASKSLAIRGPLMMGVPLGVRKPLFFHRTEFV